MSAQPYQGRRPASAARRACFAELLSQQSTHGEQRLEGCLKCERDRQLDTFGPIVLAGQLLIERQMLRIDCPLPGDTDLLFTDG